MRPIAACAMGSVERTRVSQVTPESPGTPRAVVYGLSRALPGDQALGCHRHRRCLDRRLDASLEASGPHAFAVRFRRCRKHPPRPPHPRPTFVAIANAPLSGTGFRKYRSDLSQAQALFLLFRNNLKIHALGASARPVAARRDGHQAATDLPVG
jgi:hypothetical protein